MKRALLTISLLVSLPMTLSLTCGSPFEPQPSRLSSPVLSLWEITAMRVQGEYREIIHLRWNPPPTDSISLTGYRILRQMEHESASVELVIQDPLIVDFYERVNQIIDFGRRTEVLNPDSAIKTIIYRIVAIDSLERPGDTSAACSVFLAPFASLTYPEDTLKPSDIFRWTVHGLALGYQSRMSIWDSSGIVWNGAYSPMRYSDPYIPEPYQDSPPDSITAALLDGPKPSTFTWGISIQAAEKNPPPGSITFGKFTIYE